MLFKSCIIIIIIRSLVNARVFQVECGRVLHETLLVSVLICKAVRQCYEEEGDI